MKLLNFIIVRLTLSLIAGIFLAAKLDVPFSIAMTLSLFLTLLLFLFWFVKRKTVSTSSFFGILTLIVFSALGMLVYTVNDPTLSSQHYTNFENLKTKEHQIVFTVKERLKNNSYNDRYIGNLLELNGNRCRGQLLINVPVDSLNSTLKIDQIIMTNASITDINTPLNPFQFNYAEYLKHKHIYGQIYLDKKSVNHISYRTNSLFGLADNFRRTINSHLIGNGINGNSLALINALLLGQRQDIDDTIYNNYVNAGVIHILAVSGLHVGILLIILNVMLRPLLYLQHGKFIKLILLILFLWAFAVVTGLSASVTRSVAMFSIVTIAYFYRRATNIYNTLAISAFFILLIKPNFLFEVGFQLSYLAVIAIVSIQPIIYGIWQPKFILLNKLWQIFSVTLAAQFGVVPISLYYFHQFPGLFFVSNLVIIPTLGIILTLGLLVILLSLLNILPSILSSLFSIIIDSLNGFISWVASFESFLLQDLSFGLLQMVSAYIMIIAIIYFTRTKTYRAAFYGLISIILFQSFSLFYRIDNSQNELVIFNKSRSSVLLIRKKDHMTIYSNLHDSITENLKLVKDYKVGRFASTLNTKPLKDVYNINTKVIFVVDSMGVYSINSFQPDFVLLRNSPKINLDRLLDHLDPKVVIADASNYRTYVQRWKASCLKRKIPFHYTYEKGAFIYP